MTITVSSYASLFPSLSFADLYDPCEDAPCIRSSVGSCSPGYLPDTDPSCVCVSRPDGIVDVF